MGFQKLLNFKFLLMIGAIALIIILGFGNTGSVITLSNEIPYSESKTTTFDGGSVVATAPIFGSTNSDAYGGVFGTNSVARICEGGSEGISLSSQLQEKVNGFYSSGKLSSSLDSGNCGDYTSQSGQITFTKDGTVTANCKIVLSVYDKDTANKGDGAMASCKIGSNTLSYTSTSSSFRNYQETKTYTIEVKSGDTLNYELSHKIKTQSDRKSSEVTLDLTFVPSPGQVSSSDLPSDNQEPSTVPVQTKLTWIDRINISFQNFINKLRGLFQ